MRDKFIARVFGIFFILAFLFYGTGNGIIQSILESAEGFGSILDNRNQIITGSIMMGIFHTFFNIGLAVIMFKVLRNYNWFIAQGYFSAAIVSTMLLAMGSVFLIVLVPVSEAFSGGEITGQNNFDTLLLLVTKLNFFCYQFGMTIWGIGGIMLSYLLYQSKIVPRFISVWGYIGYAVFIAGTISEVSGLGYGIELALPGGLFEIFMSFWLIFKGFSTKAEQPMVKEQLIA